MGQESSSSSPMNDTTVVRSSASTSQQPVDVGRNSLSYLVRSKVTAFVAEICYTPRIFLVFDLHPRLLDVYCFFVVLTHSRSTRCPSSEYESAKCVTGRDQIGQRDILAKTDEQTEERG